MSIPTLKIPIKGFIKQGDTIPEILVDMGSEFEGDLTSLHIVRMQVYQGNNPVIDIDSTPSKGGITITGDKTFTIDEIQENNLPVDTIKGDLQIETYSDFAFDPINVQTYFNVEYKIIKQYTRI